MDVKIEINRLMLCYGCLSSDRKLTQVTGPLNKLFTLLLSDGKETFNNVHAMLCWECIALLRKIKAFQKQTQLAQFRLIANTPYFCQDTKDDMPASLSPLTTVRTKYYDYIYNYNDHTTELYLNQTIEIKIPTNPVIKEENDTLNIKIEELTNKDSNFSNSDEDYDDKDTKVNDAKTNVKEIIVKDKKDAKNIRKENNYYQSIREYEKYATISERNLEFNSEDIEKYYKIVYLDENEYETYIKCMKSEKLTYKCKKTLNKCVECHKAYFLLLDLMRHKALNHDTSPFPRKCTSCKTVLNTQDEVTAHWREVHTVMLQCTLCDQACRNTAEVRKHLNRAHTKIYVCNECNMDIPTLRQFSVHYREAHQRCVCDYCKKIFFEKRRLKKHIIRLHLPPYCNICHRSYKSYKLYNRHYVTYHPKTIDNNKKDLSYCVECDRQFSTVHFYKKHLKESVKHKQRKKLSIPCPECGKTFTKRANMRNHYDAIHKNVTKHYCTICDKYLSTGNAIRTHIAYVHHKVQMPKNKICDLCGRGFSTKRILDNHRRTHTGERPFKCQYCPASFAQITAMKTHQKTQHKNISLMSNIDSGSNLS